MKQIFLLCILIIVVDQCFGHNDFKALHHSERKIEDYDYDYQGYIEKLDPKWKHLGPGQSNRLSSAHDDSWPFRINLQKKGTTSKIDDTSRDQKKSRNMDASRAEEEVQGHEAGAQDPGLIDLDLEESEIPHADLMNMFLTITLPTSIVLTVVLLICYFVCSPKGAVCKKVFPPPHYKHPSVMA